MDRRGNQEEHTNGQKDEGDACLSVKLGIDGFPKVVSTVKNVGSRQGQSDRGLLSSRAIDD